ncbi:MAG TPA: hypothetical protein VMF08_19715, partial [Candidatus Sulfotelmatobacter sp.]|nr:hypothetical protein [Candidatus Sulfotelmatobacter sp.]
MSMSIASIMSLTPPMQFMALAALMALVALATPLQLSPRSRLMGGQFAETLSKTDIFHKSFPPMALARPPFSVIWGIFGAKTVSKTHFFDHQKGQFPFRQCHRLKKYLYSIPPKTGKNLTQVRQFGMIFAEYLRVRGLFAGEYGPKGFGEACSGEEAVENCQNGG